MTTPDKSVSDTGGRPKLVVWAYRCWAVSGALLIALGVAAIVLGALAKGPTLEPIGFGIIVVVVGVAYVLLGGKAFVGDIRWRSSLSALTLVAVILLLILSFGDSVIAFALLASLVGLFGSLLAYRPEADQWYNAVAARHGFAK